MNQQSSGWFRDHWKAIFSVALFLALLAYAFASTAAIQPAASATNLDSSALLAIIAAAAVGIERTIEGVWTVLGYFVDAWWPMNLIGRRARKLEEDVKTQLDAVYKAMETVAPNSGTQNAAEEAKKLIDDMKARVQDLQKLSMGNERVSMFAATALQNIAMAEHVFPQVESQVRIANQAIAGLTDFVGSFRDNPVRRGLSLVAGSLLGLYLAGLMRLDVFMAVLGSAPKLGNMSGLGIALTGLIIGLGSGPTHEVVRALQEVKKVRAAQSPSPTTQDSGTSRPTIRRESGERPEPLVGVAGLEEAPTPGVRDELSPLVPPTRRFR